MNQIAVLITCHNRKEKTLSCLDYLYAAINKVNRCLFHVFLVDDGSTDGTGEIVGIHFPQVTVIKGNGNLFWNGGMRLAWETAKEIKDYDYYLWLNDDTFLDNNAIIELLECHEEALIRNSQSSIIVGSCRADVADDLGSYGGRTKTKLLIPNGELQNCLYINGNIVLIPKEIFEILGNLSPEYTHGIGDFDYGLRAIQAGFNCYVTRKYIAVCPRNQLAKWCNPKTPIVKRFQLLYSPKGLNLIEYLSFRKKYEGKKWIVYAIKAYLKTLSPSVYHYLTKIIRLIKGTITIL